MNRNDTVRSSDTIMISYAFRFKAHRSLLLADVNPSVFGDSLLNVSHLLTRCMDHLDRHEQEIRVASSVPRGHRSPQSSMDAALAGSDLSKISSRRKAHSS